MAYSSLHLSRLQRRGRNRRRNNMERKKRTEAQTKAVIPDIAPISKGQASSEDTLLVVTGEAAATRGPGGAQPLQVEKLAVNVNLFVQQMGKVLESTPEKLGRFHFDEFEIHAEEIGRAHV